MIWGYQHAIFFFCVSVRTAPVKGAPRHPCTPHKYADQESLLWYLLVNCGVRLGSRDLKIHFILYYIKYKFLLFCWKWSKNHRVLDITGNDDKNTRNTMVILLFNVVWNRDATIYGLLTYMRNTFQSSVLVSTSILAPALCFLVLKVIPWSLLVVDRCL